MAWSGKAALIALLMAGAGAASAQPGAVVTSDPIKGLAQGTGAPFPKGHQAALDALPDWGGIWFVVFPRGPGAGAPPPPPRLKGKYKDDYEAWRKALAASNGVEKKTSSNCSPPGMPGIMQIPQYPFEFLFTPGRVTINQEAWMQTRKIWTDGRPHQEDPDPSFMGDSIGHWEGGTLVVDTIGINAGLQLQAGMAHSDKLKITERIHLSTSDPDVLINEMTYTDPDALEEPYTKTVTYHRDRYGALLEFECSENDRNPVDEKGDTQFN
ncbi:hypothetical protein [Sphingobium nicotianae]|uniref:Uncharacterized protein n=1 Tax=Sphingobium nicotianae TaxID=2782607 RepID=A0A9X1D9Q9_9SPHN|nr:hypothetical protein [Sphingobium nicotianae]MBT2185962.1 hypothetical protein [Sphingobium nicotianae]